MGEWVDVKDARFNRNGEYVKGEKIINDAETYLEKAEYVEPQAMTQYQYMREMEKKAEAVQEQKIRRMDRKLSFMIFFYVFIWLPSGITAVLNVDIWTYGYRWVYFLGVNCIVVPFLIYAKFEDKRSRELEK